MEDQQQILTHTFENWLTENPAQTEEQIDDVLVIGFRLQPIKVNV